jgi:hypothetical protein
MVKEKKEMISKWLERDDEKLLSQIQNSSEAKKLLTLLLRQRVNQVVAMLAILLFSLIGNLIIMVLAFVASSIGSDSSIALAGGQGVAISTGIMLGFLAIMGVNYLSVDTRIKMIKIALSLKSTNDTGKE